MMNAAPVDPALLLSWLSARSVARGLPLPVPDRGGFQVRSDLPTETCRWVFPGLCDGIAALGREITLPRHFIKLCGSDDALRAALPPAWHMLPRSYFMTAAVGTMPAAALPVGYTLRRSRDGSVATVEIVAANGDVAASGHAVEAAGVFVYDRIETAPLHRRRGLGRIVMQALREQRISARAPELLVATEVGRSLYVSLGWRVLSPYATAVIPD